MTQLQKIGKLEKIIVGTAIASCLAVGISCNPKLEQPLILKTQFDNYEVWEIKSTKYEVKHLTAQEVCPSVLNYFFNQPLLVGSSGQSESSYPEVTLIFPIGRFGQSRASLQIGLVKLEYVGTINSLEIPEDYKVCNL